MLTNKIIGNSEIIQLFNPSQNKVHECIVTKCNYYNVIFHPLLNQFFGQSKLFQGRHLFIARRNIQNRLSWHILELRESRGHNMHCFWLRSVKCSIWETRILIWKACSVKVWIHIHKRNEEIEEGKTNAWWIEKCHTHEVETTTRE